MEVSVEERFAEDHAVLSHCDEEEDPIEGAEPIEEDPNYPYCDEDYEAFKVLPVAVADPSYQANQEVPQLQVEQKPFKTVVPSFKISPDHPQIKVYRGYLKMVMGKGDIQELAELVYEIKDQGFDEHVDISEAEDLIFGE